MKTFLLCIPNADSLPSHPWRLALVTVMQFVENLSDRQTAEAVRARIDWKYALGLQLTDPGFDFSILSEFRGRLIAGTREHLLLDQMLEVFRQKKMLKARGRQRTDSTHVLAAIRTMTRLELVTETLRAALNDLAAKEPDCLKSRIGCAPSLPPRGRSITATVRNRYIFHAGRKRVLNTPEWWETMVQSYYGWWNISSQT